MFCIQQSNILFYEVLTCARSLDISEVPLCTGVLPWLPLPDILTLLPLLSDLGARGLYFRPLTHGFIRWYCTDLVSPQNVSSTGSDSEPITNSLRLLSNLKEFRAGTITTVLCQHQALPGTLLRELHRAAAMFYGC